MLFSTHEELTDIRDDDICSTARPCLITPVDFHISIFTSWLSSCVFQQVRLKKGIILWKFLRNTDLKLWWKLGTNTLWNSGYNWARCDCAMYRKLADSGRDDRIRWNSRGEMGGVCRAICDRFRPSAASLENRLSDAKHVDRSTKADLELSKRVLGKA